MPQLEKTVRTPKGAGTSPAATARDRPVRATKHVALLVETSRTYGRDLLKGIHRYLAEHEHWSLFLELRALDSQVPRWLSSWQGDGIIARTGSAAMAEAIAATRLPGVELRASKIAHGLPFLGCDNRDIGRIVADHFIDNGFAHFAVFDLDTERYFEERRDNFRAHLAARGHTCHEHHAARQGERPANWERHQADVARWVASLPKPVGVFACTDQLAFWLLDACRRAGVAVPEEVAVVGAENDETLCTLARPQLSSVAFDGERVGYEAAALLDRMMAGEAQPSEPILVAPTGLVVRQSSDIMAIDDPQVAAAVRYIREHACHGINVADVVKHAGLSRTLIERRMRQAIGRTPGEEIIRLRFNRVKQLLTETELSLAAIANRCGFEHPQYMAEAFKKHFGITPGTYRTGGRKT
jgi:LacI family transcriptional regulator